MSDHGQGNEREHNHAYTVLVRPRARIGISADTGQGGLEAFSLSIDYDESGVSAPGTIDDTTASASVADAAATDATTGDRRDVGRRELDLELYRDDKRVFSTEGGIDLDASELLGYADDVAVAVSDLSRRLR